MTKWEHLLGGYATGTLTGEERAALMQAALSDQALFDLLMDEEALREALADPATRAALLRALDSAAKPRAWWLNPWPWTGLGAVAAALALVVVLRPVDAPRPAQMAQNRPAAAAPEPVPSVIPIPKQLRLSEPQPVEKTAAGRAAVSIPEAQMAPAAPASPMPAKKEKAIADAATGPAAESLAVTISYQTSDGVWHPLDLASAIPANRPLRLQVTSSRPGLLALQPPLAEARTLLAGVATEFDLPAQPPGPLRFRLALNARAPMALGRVANELREGTVRVMPQADAAAAPTPPSNLTREILLRIE